MNRGTANCIVGTYEAMVKVNGKEYADKHYLAKGTKRYAMNLGLLKQARRIVKKGKAKNEPTNYS